VIDPARVAASVRALPTPSAAVARLHALARDPRSSAADLDATIRPDPALTANLLKLANSAHFGLRHRVGTAREAIALLGVRRVCEVATSAAFAPLIPDRLPGYDVDARAFWGHCVAVAVLAERVALAGDRGARRGAPDLLFTAGLLHDLGKLAVAAFVAEGAGAILGRVRSGGPFAAAEREVLGVDHGEVGALVAEAWALPPPVAWAARWHHAPAAAPEEARPLCALVHVADALAHSLGLGADAGELARAIDPEAARLAGASVRTLERVASESLDAIGEMTRALGAGGGIG
jgi:putative nucleotidyltransferase with HDIG domain